MVILKEAEDGGDTLDAARVQERIHSVFMLQALRLVRSAGDLDNEFAIRESTAEKPSPKDIADSTGAQLSVENDGQIFGGCVLILPGTRGPQNYWCRRVVDPEMEGQCYS